jgi:endonuclease IV
MGHFKLGGHLSADEGLSYAVATARGLCYNEVQLMNGKGRDYAPWEITDEVAATFRKMTYEMAITLHLPYVINPCEGMKQRRAFYKRHFKDQIATAEALGARRVVLHPGFKKELSEPEAFKNIVDFLDDVWNESWQVDFLLETDSGSKNGSAIGSPEFIAEVAKKVQSTTVRMCVDTTHMYARGVNLWDANIRKEFIEEYRDLTSLVHLNVPDREVGLGSHLDRHNTAFEQREEMNHPPFIRDWAEFPMILERRSLHIQQLDNSYVRKVLGQPLEKQKASA